MRLLFLILLLGNAAAFGYIRYAEGRAGADAQNSLLQISPEKVKLLKPAAPLPATRNGRDAAIPQSSLACLEWGGFAAEDAVRAATVLARFDLGAKLSQRENAEGYQVYVASLKTRADADKKAAELKALGVGDLTVVQENDPSQFAISLGAFKTEGAANNYLAQLRQKGVRSAVAGPRGAKTSIFVIRDPGDAIAAKIAELKAEFPAAVLRAAACADTQQSAKNQ
jgi:SPOR domain